MKKYCQEAIKEIKCTQKCHEKNIKQNTSACVTVAQIQIRGTFVSVNGCHCGKTFIV